MKKGNVIDLEMYRQRQEASQDVKAQTPAVSDELGEAIEILIQRLKATGPITQSH